MMRRHFAAIDRVVIAHRPFLEIMPRPRQNRPPPAICDNILRVPDHARVMHDHGTLIPRQKRLRQQPHHVFARHKAAFVIEQETAVEIPVPRHPEIRLRGHHGLPRNPLVFRQHRVRDAMGKRRVRVMVHPHEPQQRALRPKCRRNRIECRPRSTVARIHKDLQRQQGLQISKRQHPRHIRRPHVRPPGPHPARRRHRIKITPFRHIPDPRHVGSGVKRHRPRPHQFHPVVADRVVRCRHHHPAIRAKMAGCEIHLLRPAQAKVDHIGPRRDQTLRHRQSQIRRRRPCIPAQHNHPRAHHLCKGPPDPRRDLAGQVHPHPPAHVIGLETGQWLHAAPSLFARRRYPAARLVHKSPARQPPAPPVPGALPQKNRN